MLLTGPTGPSVGLRMVKVDNHMLTMIVGTLGVRLFIIIIEIRPADIHLGPLAPVE